MDSELVLAIDAKQLGSSGLWREYWPRFESKVAAGLSQLSPGCGLDVWRATDSIAIAIKQLGAESPSGVVVVHGPDVARVLDCAAATKAEGAVVTRDHDIVMTKTPTTTVAAKIVGGNTLVLEVGPNTAAASLTEVLVGGAPLRQSPTFSAYLGKLDAHPSLWAIVNGNSKIAQQLSAVGAHPRAIYGALTATDSIAFGLHLELSNADEATQLGGMLKPQLTQVATMFEKLDVSNAGAVLSVDGSLTSAQIANLLSLVNGAIGGG